MKHIFTKSIAIVAMLFVAAFVWAQDVIVTTDGQRIDAKIMEVSKQQVKYKELDNLDGPTFVLEVEEIGTITYANGKVVTYNKISATVQTPATTSASTDNEKPAQPTQVVDESTAEILLLTGEKIVVQINSMTQNIVTYTLNGQYNTMATSRIETITFLQNGQVRRYNEHPQVSISTANTSASTQAVEEYNVEILLMSGAVVRGQLMEKTDNQVSYMLGGKYCTIPATQIDKVTNLQTGEVIAYHGARLNAQSSTSTITTSGGRIYRDNGHYLCNNTYISSKEVERILERENGLAYAQWQKADRMLIGGAVCVGIGGGLVIGGLFTLITGDNGACIGMECAALVPLGIGLGLSLGSSSHYNKAIDIYNSKYDHAAVQFKWNVAPNQVGVAFAF